MNQPNIIINNHGCAAACIQILMNRIGVTLIEN